MTEPPSEDQVRQFTHDLRQCLHVIGIGIAILEKARHDDEKFAEICTSIGREHDKASQLITEFADQHRTRPT